MALYEGQFGIREQRFEAIFLVDDGWSADANHGGMSAGNALREVTLPRDA
jgi:hypothetical protein